MPERGPKPSLQDTLRTMRIVFDAFFRPRESLRRFEVGMYSNVIGDPQLREAMRKFADYKISAEALREARSAFEAKLSPEDKIIGFMASRAIIRVSEGTMTAEEAEEYISIVNNNPQSLVEEWRLFQGDTLPE